MEEKLKQVLKKVLDIESESISDNTSQENTLSWDSFNSLLLISEIEKNFQVEFDVDEVAGIKNVGDIKNLLRKHGVK